MAIDFRTGKIVELEVGRTQYGYWANLYDSIELPDGVFTGRKIFFAVPNQLPALNGSVGNSLHLDLRAGQHLDISVRWMNHLGR